MKKALTPAQIQKFKELAKLRHRLENLGTRLRVARLRLVVIPKQDLIPGAYYAGCCRNAKIARWDGKIFHHWHYDMGRLVVDTIHCPEDEAKYDVFQAWERIPPLIHIPLGDQ